MYLISYRPRIAVALQPFSHSAVDTLPQSAYSRVHATAARYYPRSFFEYARCFKCLTDRPALIASIHLRSRRSVSIDRADRPNVPTRLCRHGVPCTRANFPCIASCCNATNITPQPAGAAIHKSARASRLKEVFVLADDV